MSYLNLFHILQSGMLLQKNNTTQFWKMFICFILVDTESFSFWFVENVAFYAYDGLFYLPKPLLCFS